MREKITVGTNNRHAESLRGETGRGATWGNNGFENPPMLGAGCMLRKDFRSP